MKRKVSFLDNEVFYRKLVPFYKKKRDCLLEILKDELYWERKILPYKLAVVNNSETEKKFYFYISNRLSGHTYFENRKPPYYQVGYSTHSLFDQEQNYSDIIDMLRSVFIRALLQKAHIKDIFNYFKRLLNSNYTDYEIEKNRKYLRLAYLNLKLAKGLFAISAFRVNLIFPIANKIYAEEIKDNSADNKKILITNREKVQWFYRFDEILSLNDLSLHIKLFGFTEDVQLYKDITGLDYKTIFSIIDLLKTSESSKKFELQKELVNLDYSRGNIFENYLNRFLTLCFCKNYKKLSLDVQLSTRRNLRRRDFIITNHNSTNPFLKKLELMGMELLLFDAKNYKGKMSSNDLDAFRKYILDNHAFGNFGIILSRDGVNQNCEEDIFRGFLSSRVKILILTQVDLLRMLDYYGSGRSPIDVIKEKYYEFIKQF